MTLLAGVLTLFVVLPASANHPVGSSLQVIKEINSAPVNRAITLRAVLSAPAVTAVDIAFEFEGGPYEGTDAVGSNTADEICTIAAAASECTISVTATASGTGLVRAWVDHDKLEGSETGGVREADTGEGRLANGDPYMPIVNPGADCLHPDDQRDTRFDQCADGEVAPGNNENEPDTTDVVQVTWTDAPSRIECFDSNPLNGTDVEVNTLDQDETYTCRASDSSGRPVGGVAIDGEHLGGLNEPGDQDADAAGSPDYDWRATTPPDSVNDSDSGCETDSGTGECTITIEALGQSSATAFAQICFWLDTDRTDGPPEVNGDSDFDQASEGTSDGGDCDLEKAQSGEDTDATDVVALQWRDESPVGTFVDVNPEVANATVGVNTGITATVYSQFGDKFVGSTTVRAERFEGSPSDTDGNSTSVPDGLCTTSNSDSCTIAFASSAAGSARICSYIGTAPTLAGDNNNGTCAGEDVTDGLLNPQDVTRILWTASAATTTTTTPGGGGGGNEAQGYSLVGEDGSLYAFGSAKNVGDMRGTKLNAPVIGVAYTPGGNGYWLVAKDGGIFTFGDAAFFGSMGDQKLNSPVLGMAATPTGKGYWLFAGDGGIFTFGDAAFFGSMGDQKLNQPVINMEPLASGNGYWLVAADGGIFSFGKADFYGSMGDQKINQPVFDMTSTDTDKGYWLIARDGGVFSFGDAAEKFYGNPVNETNPKPTRIIGMDSTPASFGYWIADASGKVWNYGNAQALGDRFGLSNPAPMIGFASVPGTKP